MLGYIRVYGERFAEERVNVALICVYVLEPMCSLYQWGIDWDNVAGDVGSSQLRLVGSFTTISY